MSRDEHRGDAGRPGESESLSPKRVEVCDPGCTDAIAHRVVRQARTIGRPLGESVVSRLPSQTNGWSAPEPDAGAVRSNKRMSQMSKSPSSLLRLEVNAIRRPSGDTRGRNSSSGDCVSRSGTRLDPESGWIHEEQIPLHIVGSTMREHDAAVRSPGRCALIAIELEHPLRHTATRIRHVEIESLASIPDKSDAFAVGRPGRLTLRRRETRELPCVAAIRRRRSRSDRGSRPRAACRRGTRRDRACRRPRSALQVTAPAGTAESLWPGGDLTWRGGTEV